MISELFLRLFDLLSPRSCAICGQRLPIGVDTLCMACNMDLPRTNFASEPYENELARHFWGKFQTEKAAAWFYYLPKAASTQMIKDMKYHDHPVLAQRLGLIAASEFSALGFFEGIDLIVPVPLTRSRQRSRGFNQSLEIAHGVRHITGIPIADDVLKRVQFAESQTKKDTSERAQNVEGAFRLKHAEKVAGKHVLLIDDVVTTGATLSECGIELSRAGNVRISIMTLGFTKS